MLMETTGQVICTVGRSASEEQTAMASLIIGWGMAGKELGKLMGETEHGMFTREGIDSHLITTFITSDMMLNVFVQNSAKLGLARFKIKQYQKLLQILVERFKTEQQKHVNPLADISEEEVDQLLGF